MSMHLATTDSLSRTPSVTGTATAPTADTALASSPFDLLLLGPAVAGPSEQVDPAVESADRQAEDIHKDGDDPQAQAIVAPVVVLPMLPLDAANEELPREFVLSITAEPAAADPLAVAADGQLVTERSTTPGVGEFPGIEPDAGESSDEVAAASLGTILLVVPPAADAVAPAKHDPQAAESHPTDKSDAGESRDSEQTKDRDSLSDQLPLPVADLSPTGPPAATPTPLDQPPASSLVLQPSVLPQAAPRAESPPVASSQPATSESRPIDTARLLHRVARAFAAAKDGGEVRLRLSPPELGALVLDVRVQEGALVARLEAETTSVRTVLVENLPALRDRLAEQGIRIERFDVDLRQPGGGSPDWSAHQPFQESSSREQPARERRLPQVAEGVVARTTRVPSHDSRRLNVIV